ncbi:kinase-like protein [Melanomma pulvis-pyrius CBS 109.77]|uniref:EKC/KEOPS complex subunit BUD32 n=1 Tax=Melanomma pulvis-pyrius CBS 109.77 TaxID=1314802 RepID=A0A6A6XQ79_9PLEO|nr:kinase-like protein [Melanomma pulvis-pyrius CBS 109.77]
MATATDTPATPPPQHTIHILPAPFTHSPLTLLAQGAEALVYRTVFLTPHTPCVLKYRPPKPYRHPILDKRLTKARLLAEARVLVKCRKDGVTVPAVLGLDAENGWMVLEWVEGGSVRGVLDGWVAGGGRFEGVEAGNGVWGLMRRIGRAVGRVHDIGVCHGDLTTSNLMVRTGASAVRGESEGPQTQTQMQRPKRLTPSALREAAMTSDAPPVFELPPEEPPPPPSKAQSTSDLEGDIVLIDFGLATQTVQDEDRAVDLYVLERAFAATHPGAEALFQEVLRSYGESYKGGRSVLRKLEDVRLRGRKRSMLG